MSQSANMGKLAISVWSKDAASREIPKQMEIYDSGLRLLDSYWLRSDQVETEIKAGIYLVRLTLPSAKQFEKVVELAALETCNIHFNLGDLSPKENQEWIFFNNSNAGVNPVKRSLNIMHTNIIQPFILFRDIQINRWKYQYDRWMLISENVKVEGVLNQIGKSLSFNNVSGLELLEIQSKSNVSYYVVIPEGNKVTVVLRAVRTEIKDTKVEAFVSTSNKDAEAILGFMASGDMPRAGSILADKAESLLQDKVQDVAAATIGAYYLVKARDWERTHDWLYNLSNWFPFLSDGPLLCAWEIIGKEKEPEKKLFDIRKLLLESVRRGIPVYTQGLKLLYEGLVMLKNQNDDYDPQVEQGLVKISSYMAAADLTKDYVSFFGTGPDKPGSGFSQGSQPVDTPTQDYIRV
jgi:hypothetical protein